MMPITLRIQKDIKVGDRIEGTVWKVISMTDDNRLFDKTLVVKRDKARARKLYSVDVKVFNNRWEGILM